MGSIPGDGVMGATCAGSLPGEAEADAQPLTDRISLRWFAYMQHTNATLSARSITLALGSTRNALVIAGIHHVVADQVPIEHGNSERDIAMRWAVDHSLADDLRTARAEALMCLAQRGGNV